MVCLVVQASTERKARTLHAFGTDVALNKLKVFINISRRQRRRKKEPIIQVRAISLLEGENCGRYNYIERESH